MWSVGVVTFILLSGISPFLGDDDQETTSYVQQGDFDFDHDDGKVFEKVTEDAKCFIEELLVVKPRYEYFHLDLLLIHFEHPERAPRVFARGEIGN